MPHDRPQRRGADRARPTIKLGRRSPPRPMDIRNRDPVPVTGEPRTFAPNCEIIAAGHAHDALHLVRDGWLVRSRLLHDGRRQIVDFMLPGDIVGLEAAVFGRSPYAVVTVTPVALCAIAGDVAHPLLLDSAVRRAAILGERLVDAARRTAYERISHLLLELYVRLRRAGRTDGMSFDLPLTQRLIGDALGLTTVHVNRTLRALREDGLIRLANGRATIRDFTALSRLSDFDLLYLGEDAPFAPHQPTRLRAGARSME